MILLLTLLEQTNLFEHALEVIVSLITSSEECRKMILNCTCTECVKTVPQSNVSVPVHEYSSMMQIDVLQLPPKQPTVSNNYSKHPLFNSPRISTSTSMKVVMDNNSASSSITVSAKPAPVVINPPELNFLLNSTSPATSSSSPNSRGCSLLRYLLLHFRDHLSQPSICCKILTILNTLAWQAEDKQFTKYHFFFVCLLFTNLLQV